MTSHQIVESLEWLSRRVAEWKQMLRLMFDTVSLDSSPPVVLQGYDRCLFPKMQRQDRVHNQVWVVNSELSVYPNTFTKELPSELLSIEEENIGKQSWMESTFVLSTYLHEVVASLYRASILGCIEWPSNDHSIPPAARVVMPTTGIVNTWPIMDYTIIINLYGFGN